MHGVRERQELRATHRATLEHKILLNFNKITKRNISRTCYQSVKHWISVWHLLFKRKYIPGDLSTKSWGPQSASCTCVWFCACSKCRVLCNKSKNTQGKTGNCQATSLTNGGWTYSATLCVCIKKYIQKLAHTDHWHYFTSLKVNFGSQSILFCLSGSQLWTFSEIEWQFTTLIRCFLLKWI